jgi:hypothetical protein
MNRLRITATGWSSFTGHFGSTEFKDGVSVNPLDRKAIDHVSALVGCELVDENGNDAGEAGIAARMIGALGVGNDDYSAPRLAMQSELDAENLRLRTENGRQPTKIYTKEELETIAEKESIKGLRQISDKWHVHDRSIPRLIAAVLRAQSSFVARQAEKKAEQDRSRTQAAQKALEEEAERQAAFDARARLLATVVPSETPNAVGENGEAVYIAPQTDESFGPKVNVSDTLPTTMTSVEPEIGTPAAASIENVAIAPTENVAASLAVAVENLAQTMHATPDQVVAALDVVKADQQG